MHEIFNHHGLFNQTTHISRLILSSVSANRHKHADSHVFILIIFGRYQVTKLSQLKAEQLSSGLGSAVSAH